MPEKIERDARLAALIGMLVNIADSDDVYGDVSVVKAVEIALVWADDEWENYA